MSKEQKNYLKNLVQAKGLDIGDFVRPGLSRNKMSKIMNGHQIPNREDREKMAEILTMPFEDLDGQITKILLNQDISTLVGNVDLSTARNLHPIPEFDLKIAAGSWVDVLELGEMRVDSPEMIQGLFRVRISGNSMEPGWKDGSLVEFKLLSLEDDLQIGSDYYVQKDNDTGTFKRLAKITEGYLVLRALNLRKYPDAMRVERREIVRMALAKWVLTKGG